MRRSEILWLAFEKFAIFFSFVVALILVLAVLLVSITAWRAGPMLRDLRDGLVCDTVTGLNTLLDDLENAVITRTIPISQTIPAQFEVPLDMRETAKLTEGVPIDLPATYTLPAGGGRINGTVSLELPKGQKLPIHLQTSVPVDQQLPVVMDVFVSIPLRETELGEVIQELRELLAPLQLEKLEETLQCPTAKP
jgi:hypothetical protein